MPASYVSRSQFGALNERGRSNCWIVPFRSRRSGEHAFYVSNQCRRGDVEVLEDEFTRGREAEGVDAEGLVDVLGPAERRAGLERHRGQLTRKHFRAVVEWLRLE